MIYEFDRRHLEAEMIRKDITRKDLAKAIDVSYTTINAKFNGLSQWDYIECLHIQKQYFPEKNVDEVFKFHIKTNTA